MGEHSVLPPSSAARRVQCPGSRALEAKYPEDEESPHAREGEAAHWVATQVLLGVDSLPPTAPNGHDITTEMLEGADIYHDSIVSVCNKLFGEYDHKKLHIEERVSIARIHPECWGTPDCWLHYGNQLHIWDYKFGHGYVDVFENWQLIEYAAGILDAIGVDGIADQMLDVYFYIIQPRCYARDGAVRTWKVKASGLRPLFNILQHAESQAIQEHAICKPSPECRYCTARHACEALQQSALSATDIAKINTPLPLKPSQLGNELRMLKHAAEILESRITGLEEEAIGQIKRGNLIPGYTLEQSQGREVWRSEAQEVITLGELMGIDLKKTDAVITPLQAIKAGVPEAVVKRYTKRQQGALKLVTCNSLNARKIFGKNL